MQQWLVDQGLEVWAVVWDVFVVVAVPILVGAAAAGVVVGQLSQVKKHRRADRRAEGVAELSQMILANADLAVRGIDRAVAEYRAKTKGVPAPDGPPITQLDRFRHNEYYVRAQAQLAEDSAAIGNWVMGKSEELFNVSNAALEAEGDPEKKVGAARGAAMRVATETSKQLLRWLRGEVPTSWFEQQPEAIPPK